ncbi:MAG TPA: LON peptidase substrate-binding domain-containing protein [Alphaproteobacteria bacterium]|jgi:Lon protease-like protein
MTDDLHDDLPNGGAMRVADLPRTLPIFPLQGVLLLPRARLPLHVFEPRYLNMMRDAIAGDRIVGMIQPRRAERQRPDDHPDVYETGCAGRITSFSETDDGRIFVTLTGLCRFAVVRELPLLRGYRRVVADYDRFAADLDADAPTRIDRPRLMTALSGYLQVQGISADWDSINETSDERLVTALSMLCPFQPSEKQALLECPTLEERGRVMTALIEMALVGHASAPPGPSARH